MPATSTPTRHARPGPDEFWAEHRAGVVSYATGLLSGDTQLAEDVAQETAVRLCRNLEVLDRPGSVRGWLRTVARNVVVDLHRRRRLRDATLVDAPEVLPQRETVADPADRVATAVDVDRLLDRLDEPQRAVLSAVYLDGLTMRAAADRLGIPVGTVKSRSHHAIRDLQRHLGARTGGCR